MAIKKVDGLEIESEAFRTKLFFFTIQKIIFILLCFILIATLFGLTGQGLFGDRVVKGKQHDFWLAYDTFARKQASTYFKIYVIKPDASTHLVAVKINQAYLQHFYIKQILPKPVNVTIEKSDIVYHFAVQADTVLTAQFFVEPLVAGWISGTISFNQDIIPITQFIFP